MVDEFGRSPGNGEARNMILSQMRAVYSDLVIYNNLTKKIEIDSTISVAMGSSEPEGLKLSNDIVQARISAGITDEDRQKLRSYNLGEYDQNPDLSATDVLWFEGLAKKIGETFEILKSMGYDESEITK